MRRPTLKKSVFVSALVLSGLIIAACGDKGPESTPTSAPADSSVLPVSFPYIFSGKFAVAGEPGPQGIPMFARLGGERGAFNNTVRAGEYTNVSISAHSSSDAGKEITFHLGHPDGPNVQAAETFVFNIISQPQFENLDLNFPRLP